MKIRAGDTVVVITGKYKGKTGQVLKVLPGKGRLVVADVNMRTRHQRSTPNRAGEIIKYEASIHSSNVMLVDPKSKKRSRVGYKIDDKGKKTRIAKRSGDEVKKAAIAKKEVAKDTQKDAKDAKDAKESEVKKKKTSASSDSSASSESSKKSPFWKKMGFGAEETGDAAEVDSGSHMQEDHSVPDQIERSSTRGSSRGS